MSRLVVTCLDDSELHNKYAEISHPLMMKYARRCKADFKIIYGDSYSKMNIYYEDYDQILYIDTDILVKRDSPDLFEYKEGVYMREYVPPGAFDEMEKQYGFKPEKYFNAGVILTCYVDHRDLYVGDDLEHFWYEQNRINCNYAENIEHHNKKILPKEFNAFHCLGEDGYFIHFAGMHGGDSVKKFKELAESWK